MRGVDASQAAGPGISGLDWPLVTTVAGSYPTSGLPPRRAIQRAVEDQIAAGIDVTSDGQSRADMIATFAQHIPGFALAPDGVWEITDALDLPAGPITVPDYVFAREVAQGRAEVKGIVTGPITLALSARIARSAPYTGTDDPALLTRLAEILEREVAALVASGARIVQVDEPLLPRALAGHLPPESANDALRSLAAVPAVPMLHVCGDIRAHATELTLLSFAVLSIENSATPNLPAFDPEEVEMAEVRLAVGCVDTSMAEVEDEEVVRQRVATAADVIGLERVWIAPDCGLRLLPADVAREKLQTLVRATQSVRAAI